MYKLNNILAFFFIIALMVSCASVKPPEEQTTQSTFAPIDTVFVSARPQFPDGLKHHVFRATKNGASGWMNIDGEWIVSPQYDTEFKREWSEGILICRKEGKYGAVNFKNEIVIPFEYNFPPSNCTHGLILVKNNAKQEAYFSKYGVMVSPFADKQPEFRNGLAVLRSGRKEFARYILDKGSPSRPIFKEDFAVINTQFDTLLEFKKVPFLLDFGTLNSNRRTFFISPNLGAGSEGQIYQAQYGYLDSKGNIAIEPKFRASDIFIPTAHGFVRDPDCPFFSNLSLVRELDDFYFIDTLGNKVFDIETNGEQLSALSDFNDYGIAGYRTFDKVLNFSRIHLIDSNGTVVYEASERTGPMSMGLGSVGHGPENNFIPIYDKENDTLRIYTPSFEPFASFPLRDSSASEFFKYRTTLGVSLSDHFILTQFLNTKSKRGYPGTYQRLIDQHSNALTSWFPINAILSSDFGNFSLLDTTKMTSALYDFDKNVLFECDSCFFENHSYNWRFFGVYKVELSTGIWSYVNYKGQLISSSFDTIEEKIINLTEQVESFDRIDEQTMNATEAAFEKSFKQSSMYQRIE